MILSQINSAIGDFFFEIVVKMVSMNIKAYSLEADLKTNIEAVALPAEAVLLVIQVEVTIIFKN